MISTLVDLLGNFYVNNDLTHFETIARTLHASVPDDLVSLQFLGLAYYRTGRVDEAVSIFNKVLRRRKTLADAASKATNEIAGDETCAAICYREATKRNPWLAKAWYDLGAALLKLKKSELAIPAFRSFRAAQPASSQALLALSQVGLSPDTLGLDQVALSR
jgi:tetratricopeptide (TPR) repeat protein